MPSQMARKGVTNLPIQDESIYDNKIKDIPISFKQDLTKK